MKLARLLPLLLLLLLGYGIASGQNAMQVRKLKKELAKISGSKEFKTATIGFCLMDVETGKILVEENAEKSLIPASTMKLITTGAGLALLGDTFRFKTVMHYVGLIKDGTLNGDINIEGFGDPTTGSDRWPETNIDSICNFFVQHIQALGIKRINGQIGVSNFAKYFPENTPQGYEVGDLPTSYGAPLFELNYRENYFDDGIDTIQIPDLYNPDIIHDTIVVRKYSPFRKNGTANIKKPEDLFVERLIIDLKKAGIAMINIPYTDEGSGIFQHLATYYSKPLLEVAAKTNQSSINLYAEAILRGINTTQYRANVLDTSIAITARFWKNEVGDLKGLRMTDGSGLSRSNLCTPKLFCKMLTAYTKRDNFISFYNTLPIAGKDGTVKNFAKGTAADGNAHIKSGSMSRVKCYAGYVTGKNGKLYAVSVMFNNFEPDATVTAACTTLISKVAELKGGKPKKTFIINRGN